MKVVVSCARCGGESIAVVENGDSIRFEHHCPKRYMAAAQVSPKPSPRIRLDFKPLRRAF